MKIEWHDYDKAIEKKLKGGHDYVVLIECGRYTPSEHVAMWTNTEFIVTEPMGLRAHSVDGKGEVFKIQLPSISEQLNNCPCCKTEEQP